MQQLILVILLAVFALPATAAPNMQPGLWEISSKSEMAGMPSMPATTVRQCIRPADIQQGNRTVPQGNDPQCVMKDYRLQGNTATWRMECKGPDAMTGSGSMTYSGTSYSGTTKLDMNVEGQSMSMVQTFSGKRIGDCK